MWDGTGENLGLTVTDAKVLSLGLAANAAPETAKPAPIDLSKGTAPAALKPVVLPPAMERAAR